MLIASTKKQTIYEIAVLRQKLFIRILVRLLIENMEVKTKNLKKSCSKQRKEMGLKIRNT